MILFEKISRKNFLSTGNHKITVDLNQNSTTLIIGSNGTGKSTIKKMVGEIYQEACGLV